jgi:hypothetical protein
MFNNVYFLFNRFNHLFDYSKMFNHLFDFIFNLFFWMFNLFILKFVFDKSRRFCFRFIIIIIKIILDLTSSLWRFMQKNYWWLQRKILTKNKNFFLYARSYFDTALIKLLRKAIAWRNCHHHHLFLCLLNIWSYTARQVIQLTSSSTKIVLINSFSWI